MRLGRVLHMDVDHHDFTIHPQALADVQGVDVRSERQGQEHIDKDQGVARLCQAF